MTIILNADNKQNAILAHSLEAIKFFDVIKINVSSPPSVHQMILQPHNPANI